jgi:hypothetical protein
MAAANGLTKKKPGFRVQPRDKGSNRVGNSFLETGAVPAAVIRGHLPVIGPHFGHCAIAPTVADVPKFLAGSVRHLVLLGGNIHFFRPKIFAEMGVHEVGDWLNELKS